MPANVVARITPARNITCSTPKYAPTISSASGVSNSIKMTLCSPFWSSMLFHVLQKILDLVDLFLRQSQLGHHRWKSLHRVLLWVQDFLLHECCIHNARRSVGKLHLLPPDALEAWPYSRASIQAV